jgi:hypothetical protein
MRFSIYTLSFLLSTELTGAFAPNAYATPKKQYSSRLYMANVPPPPNDITASQRSDLPVIQQNAYGQPTDVRYSDFLKLVNANRVEKVTFSADGTQLLGVDVDGARVKIQSLPNDPELLNSLTQHKVRFTKITVTIFAKILF